MNDIVLMEHISMQLHTEIKKYSLDNKLIKKVCMRPTFKEPLDNNQEVLEKVLSFYQNDNSAIISLNKTYYYSLIHKNNSLYLIGPVRVEIPVYTKRNINFSLPLEYNKTWNNSIFIIENKEFFYNTILLNNIFSCERLTEEEFLLNNIDDVDFYNRVNENLSKYLFDIHESESKHNSYEQECREQASIEQGDITSLELAFKEDISGEIGVLAKDKLTNIQYLAIVLITLASRSAIRGGLSSEEAFSMADIYSQSVETTLSISKLGLLMREVEREYTRRVHEIKKRKKFILKENENIYNEKVNKCKNYIFSNLHSQISVNEIAGKLNMNANYLSELFKKYEGVSVTKYITLEKINRAKNLLKYSDYTYIEIATYLGFCSQSHLGTHFKKYTGYTLKEYRDKFGNSNFFNM